MGLSRALLCFFPTTFLEIAVYVFTDFSISLYFKRTPDNEESTESENILSVEVHLVEEITSEGGIRTVPSKETLIQFTKRYYIHGKKNDKSEKKAGLIAWTK